MTREEQEQQFESAKKECALRMTQECLERRVRQTHEYNDYGFLTLYRVRKLEPKWWSPLCGGGKLGEPELSLSGTVEILSLPVLPTLVKTQDIDSRARGVFSTQYPQHITLRVKQVTKKQAKAHVPCWLEFENNLVLPVQVTAAPVLCFHEPVDFFEGTTPSTEERFRKGLNLVLEFVRNTQNMFYEQTGEEVKP